MTEYTGVKKRKKPGKAGEDAYLQAMGQPVDATGSSANTTAGGGAAGGFHAPRSPSPQDKDYQRTMSGQQAHAGGGGGDIQTTVMRPSIHTGAAANMQADLQRRLQEAELGGSVVPTDLNKLFAQGQVGNLSPEKLEELRSLMERESNLHGGEQAYLQAQRLSAQGARDAAYTQGAQLGGEQLGGATAGRDAAYEQAAQLGSPTAGRDAAYAEAARLGSPTAGRDAAYTEAQKRAEADRRKVEDSLSPLERQAAGVPVEEERVNLDDFFKSVDLVGGLSDSDQAEAQRILKDQGQNAFAKFVSSRSVVSESGLNVDQTTLQSLNDAKTAFAQGGFDDFFKAHDQFQILSNPNASDEDKAAASAAMEDLLANPNTEAGARIVKSDGFKTGNDNLDRALSIVSSAGTSATINEGDLEGLSPETVSAIRNVTNKVKQRADAAGQNFDEAKKRAFMGERVGDLGFGTAGGIAMPPPSWSNIEKARHWLNQTMSFAKSGQLNRGWKDMLVLAFRGADMNGESAWSRIEDAFNKYNSDRNASVAASVGDPLESVSVNEGEEGGDTFSSFVNREREALQAASDEEDVEIAKNKEVLKSLDTLLSGGQVSEEALASLPPEMTDRVRNIQEQSREHEIARRESALLQRFDEFEEGERQRIANVNERKRLQGKTPSLTQDVASEFQPPGTMDRVASVEEKIDRGGQLTGQDLIGLPADQQRRLQDKSTAAINRMTDVDQANAEIQLEARRRMLDPFTAAGGANIYGQGNAHQTFGRNVMSGVEQRIAQTLNDIRVNADRERAGRKETINSQYDQAIHKLSRVFATSPDKLSGAAQRRFEELESERANALSGVDIEVDRSVRDEQRTNIELLTGLQESREAAALGAEELNLEALNQAAGFAGGLDDRALRQAEVYGRGVDPISGNVRDTLAGEMGRGELGLATRDTALREAEVYGGTEGVGLSDLTTLDVSAVMTADGGLAPGVSMDDFFAAQSQLEEGFRNRFGRDASPGELMQMMKGGSIGGRTTLEAEFGREGQALDRDRFELEQEMGRGELALERELGRGRLGLDEDIERGRLALSRAEVFGGEDFISLSQIGDFGVDAIINPDGSLAEGMNPQSFTDAAGRINKGFNQKFGRSPSASEMNRIMQGQEVGGRSTLAASEAREDRRLQAETATGTITIDGKRQQTLQDFIERGELTNETSALFADQLGYIRDPITGARIETLAGKAHNLQDEEFSESTRQFNAQFFGDMIDPETGKVRAGLDSKQVANQVAQFSRQMANTERELTANIGQTWAGITGETGTPAPVSADDFGVDVSNMKSVSPMMWRNTNEYRRVSEGIQAMTGQAASDEQIMSILNGGDAMIDGAPTMEARELSTRVIQANMDREVQVNQFSQEIGLERDVFNQAEEASDREWQVTTQDVAAIFGINENTWATARNKYERELSAGKSPEEATQTAAEYAQMSFADFSSANSMFEERWGQKSRAAAIDLGMTQEQWQQTKEAQQRMQKKENQYWDGIMQGVGTVIGMDAIMAKADWDAIGDEVGIAPLSSEVQAGLDEGLETLFEIFTDQETDRLFRSSPADLSDLKTGISEMFTRDPQGAYATLTAISNKNKISRTDLEAYEKQGVPRRVALMLYDTGSTTRTLLRQIKENAFDAHGYTGPQPGELSDDHIRTVLEAEYDMTNASDEKWRQTIRDIRNGNTVKVPPKDWLSSIEDPHQRMELLSLLHGGTSFQIAAREPSTMEVVGGFAGQLLGTAIGAAAGGSDPRLKQNVMHIGHSPSGLNIYEFNYKPGLGPVGRYRGVMSNEIPQGAVIPRAILGRYDAVNYSKVDVDFERLR